MKKKISEVLIIIVSLFLIIVTLTIITNKIEKANLPVANIHIKDYGNIEIELYPKKAPNTVNNFIDLANSKFYDGLTFHRVVNEFIVQGGDPTDTGIGGPGYFIKGEFSLNGFKDNNIKFKAGVIAMARTYEYDTAGSQFFITTADAPLLNDKYAAFGKIIAGMDILELIDDVDTDENDKPFNDIVIESITVDTKGKEYDKPNVLN